MTISSLVKTTKSNLVMYICLCFHVRGGFCALFLQSEFVLLSGFSYICECAYIHIYIHVYIHVFVCMSISYKYFIYWNTSFLFRSKNFHQCY